MSTTLLKPLVLASAVAVLIGGGAAAPATDLTASKMDWIRCPVPDFPTKQCANFSVPVDWSQPKGAQFALGISMVPAKDQSGKLGSLFFNSGGPGGAASLELYTTGGTGLFGFTDKLFETFDMVAMDPRGVGASTPIQCSSELFNKRITQFPQNQTSFTEVLDHYKKLGDSCANLTGALFNHIDSLSVARDFDAVRAAVGDDKFNYIGLSYGTVIGTAYAELFPGRIRAMALDGNLDHTQEESYAGLTEIRTYEKVLNLFFEWCETDVSCAMHPSHTNSTQSIASMWDALIDRADQSPIPAPECPGLCHADVTGEDILFNAQPNLLFKDPIPNFPVSDSFGFDWSSLGDALYQTIFANDASAFSTKLITDQNAYNASLTYAFIAVFCEDWNLTARSLPEHLYIQQLALSVAPHTRGASEFWRAALQCIAWPASVQYHQHATRITNTAPILLVNAYYDPETSYDWAVAMQSEIENSTLLTRNGVGHTSYALRGETSRAINDHVLTLKMPPPNTIYDT